AAGSIVAGGGRRTTGGRSRRRGARCEGKRSAGGRPTANRGGGLDDPVASRSDCPTDVRSERRSHGEPPRRPRMRTRREALRRSMAGLSAPACGPPAPARSAERPVKPFGDAIVIAGGPRERGRRYGRRFRDEIGEFLEREIDRAFEGSLAAKEELLRYAAACYRVIRAECPVIADELEGMAEATC